MEDKYYDVGPALTRVLSFGEVRTSKEIVLVIPGNPGVTEFYSEFIKKLHRKSGLPVLVVAHAGHEVEPCHIERPSTLTDNALLYDVAGQVKHKMDFIYEYIPSNVKIILVGHSIGCKIILELLKDAIINSRIKKCILLFPTIERMAESPNGKIFQFFQKYLHFLLIFFMAILKYMPLSLKMLLIKGYSMLTQIPLQFSHTINKLINPVVLEQVYYMAMDEMKTVRTLDFDVITRNINKLYLYYGATDRWCPIKYYFEIKSVIPKLRAHLCTLGYRHAFVLSNTTDIASIVRDWIEF